MFQSWRLQIREADEAYRQGRLQEAGDLLSTNDLRKYLQGRRLAARVAAGLAVRAQRHLAADETSEAWRVFDRVCELGGETDEVLAVRSELMRRAVQEAEARLTARNVEAARYHLGNLSRRGLSNDRSRALEQVVEIYSQAGVAEEQGDFNRAEQQWRAALALRPDFEALKKQQDECLVKWARCRELVDELRRVMTRGDWSKALVVSDQLLEIAPEFALAQTARRRAWRKVEPGGLLDESLKQDKGLKQGEGLKQAEHRAPKLSATQSEAAAAVQEPQQAMKMLLWVDAVGGYLMFFQDRITFGQAVPGNDVEAPVLADLKRRHAVIQRLADGYVLEALGPTRVNGAEITGKTVLSDGADIEFAGGVRLKFRQPHPLSASARIEFVSGHRPPSSADAIIMMAESCVLGRSARNHVVCRDWSNDVVLYREGGELFFHAMERLEVDGAPCDGGGRLGPGSHVSGEDFSFYLEPVQ